VVESQPSKLLVAGSIPVSRSIRLRSPKASYGGMVPPKHEVRRRTSLRSRAHAVMPKRELSAFAKATARSRLRSPAWSSASGGGRLGKPGEGCRVEAAMRRRRTD
jgi:hypothetical protein